MSVKTKTAIALGIAAAAVSAQAATIYGGGATLPAIAYVGKGWFVAPPGTSNRLTPSPDPGSLFDSVTQKAFGAAKATNSYCQTGSGTGRKVLIGTAGFTASGACPVFGGAAPTGFAAPAGQTDPDFAASDAPLSFTEFGTALTNKAAHLQPVQFPSIAGSIAVVYRNSDVSGRANLSSAQVCGIFSGSISNWNQINAALPSKTITVVYRADGSGTTFSFTNWLSANCAHGTFPFMTTGTFPGGGDANNQAAISPLPPVHIAASGNPGVVSSVAATEGAIGYGEVADEELRKASAGGLIDYATVNTFDPLTGFKAPTYTKLVDVAINGDDGNGRPVTTALSAPKAGCMIVAKPDSYAHITGSYPIVAITYLLAYATNAQPKAVAALLKGPYTFGVKNATKTVGAGQGFEFISPSQSFTIGQCVK